MTKEKNWKIGIVGLGYVGLPLAVHLSRHYPVLGYVRNAKRKHDLENGHDPNADVTDEELRNSKIDFTSDPAQLKQCNFIIVAVPTPITDELRPDLTAVKEASRTVGENLQSGSVVVFESTVYPGVTEDICQPIIESASGLRCGRDWKIGYSPERVNPGDKEHTIDKIYKVVSGMDVETLDDVAQVYGSFTKVHRAPNIKTAEAAKVIENIQRDLNIALVNELSIIFDRLGLRTKEVVEAAGTKWNFHKYRPGLVGGHCIGVDPYYLTFRAQELGYDPKVILAGRAINNQMPELVVERTMKALVAKGVVNPNVCVMGMTFKENVKDPRNSKAKEVINALQKNNAQVVATDPMIDDEKAREEFGVANVAFEEVGKCDALMILVPHRQFLELSSDEFFKRVPGGVVFDVTGCRDTVDWAKQGITYLTL
ncbi:MAG: nucleotide sugar dehydrogenase [bacterium]|nr:nucleotide sugar dehydrogenase [bacterium]